MIVVHRKILVVISVYHKTNVGVFVPKVWLDKRVLFFGFRFTTKIKCFTIETELVEKLSFLIRYKEGGVTGWFHTSECVCMYT